MSNFPGCEEINKERQNLGFYLPIIRDGFGWSIETLGKKLDVNKQTIANIEKQAKANIAEDGTPVDNVKPCMTYAQYITLRMIIQNELEKLPQESEDTKRLRFIVNVLVDENTDGLEDREQKEMLKKVGGSDFISAAAGATSAIGVIKLLPILGLSNPLTAPVIGVVAALPLAVSAWFGVKKDKDNKKKK